MTNPLAHRPKPLPLLALAACAWPALALSQAQPPTEQAAPENRILVQAWAEMETVVSSPIVGLIQRMPSRVGQGFRRGEPLVRFECTENEARAQIAQAELTGAQENLEAKIRLKSLDAASEIEVTTAAAQVAKAEAQLKLSQHQVGQCQLLAPFDGHVVRVMGKPFQTTTVGQPLLEIISAGVPKLRVSAASRLFPRVKVGTPLRVRIDETGLSYNAQVTLVNARIDPVNQSFEMEARIQGAAPGLLPGMSGTAVITGPARPLATTAPRPAGRPAATDDVAPRLAMSTRLGSTDRAGAAAGSGQGGR